jgi:regulator of replication initiation timing
LEINRIRDGLSDLVERTQELTLEVKNTNQMLEESESQRHAHAAAVAETMRQVMHLFATQISLVALFRNTDQKL